jgi:hypothetical protein
MRVTVTAWLVRTDAETASFFDATFQRFFADN